MRFNECVYIYVHVRLLEKKKKKGILETFSDRSSSFIRKLGLIHPANWPHDIDNVPKGITPIIPSIYEDFFSFVIDELRVQLSFFFFFSRPSSTKHMRKRACIIDFARKVERVLCPVADCEIFLENKNEKKRMRGKKKRRREGRYVEGKSERRRRRRSVKESIGEEKRGHGAVGQ